MHPFIGGTIKLRSLEEGKVNMSPIRMVKVESASRLALELNKAINKRDITVLASLLSDDCVLEDHFPPPNGTIFRGKNEVMDHWSNVFRDQPDLRIDIEDLTGMGDRCVLRWKKRVEIDAVPIRGVDIVFAKNEMVQRILSYTKG